MTTLNQYLQGIYQGEQTKTAGLTLEAELANMPPDELLKIAVGDTPEGLSKLLAVRNRAADRMAPGPGGEIPSPEKWRKHLATGERADRAIDRGIEGMQSAHAAEQAAKHQAEKVAPHAVQQVASETAKSHSTGVAKRVADRLRKLPRAAKIGIPVAAAVTGGAALLHHHRKTASVTEADAKFAWADSWGRGLARMEKDAEKEIDWRAATIGRSAKANLTSAKGVLGGGSARHALFGNSVIGQALKKEANAVAEGQDHAARHNAWADEMDKPENNKRLNEELANSGKKLFNKNLGDLDNHEWEAAFAHAKTHPHFKAIHAKHFGPEKTAGLHCGKTADMEQMAEFTTPEAQEKARVLSSALKATKGAPPQVRKAAVKVTAQKLKTAGLRKQALSAGLLVRASKKALQQANEMRIRTAYMPTFKQHFWDEGGKKLEQAKRFLNAADKKVANAPKN